MQTQTLIQNPNKVWDVLSPDRFPIHFADTYDTEEQAIEAFDKWKKQYERQGYYSSVDYGRIPLSDLIDYCHFVLIDKPESDDATA